MELWSYLLWTWLTAGVISVLGVELLRGWAVGRGIVDIPNHRSSHVVAKPRGAGLVVAAVTLAGTAVYAAVFSWPLQDGLLVVVLASTLVAIVGWMDDLWSLPWRVRLSAHVVTAGAVVWVIGPCQLLDLPVIGRVDLGTLAYPLTMTWIVGLTNAYNFMDGIDGIAAGQAVVAGAGWAIIGILQADHQLAVVGCLLASSSFGFLVHNWPPARVFLGDVGSTFLGFMLASMAVVASRRSPGLATCAVLLLWPFIFDTLFTFVRRLLRRENVFAAHRTHLYQRLVVSGKSQGSVSSTFVALALIGLGLSLAFVTSRGIGSVLILICLPVGCVYLWRLVVLTERGKG